MITDYYGILSGASSCLSLDLQDQYWLTIQDLKQINTRSVLINKFWTLGEANKLVDYKVKKGGRLLFLCKLLKYDKFKICFHSLKIRIIRVVKSLKIYSDSLSFSQIFPSSFYLII